MKFSRPKLFFNGLWLIALGIFMEWGKLPDGSHVQLMTNLSTGSIGAGLVLFYLFFCVVSEKKDK
jgi:hypothetical protein